MVETADAVYLVMEQAGGILSSRIEDYGPVCRCAQSGHLVETSGLFSEGAEDLVMKFHII